MTSRPRVPISTSGPAVPSTVQRLFAAEPPPPGVSGAGSGAGAGMKTALAVRPPPMCRSQVAERPEQSPNHPAKTEPAAGLALNVTSASLR